MARNLASIFELMANKPEFENMLWLTGERLMRLFLMLAISALMARYLGPEKFGILNYVLAVLFLFSGVSSLGLQNIVVRDIVLQPHREEIILSSAFVAHLIGAVCCMVVMILFVMVASDDEALRMLVVVASSALVFRSTSVIKYRYEAKVLSKYVVIAEVITILIGVGMRAALILLESPLIMFVVAVVVDSIVLGFMLLAILRFQRLQAICSVVNFDGGTATELLKQSWPLILTGLAISIYMRIDQLMIEAFMGPRFVGLYSVAVQLSELWYFVPVVIASSLFPAILQSRIKPNSGYTTRLQDLYNVLSFVSIAAAILVSLFSTLIVETIFGSQYTVSSSVLAVHIWTGVFVAMGVARGKWLVAENLQKYSYWFIVTAMVVNIVGNYVLIPKLGMLGAAYASLLAQFVAAIAAPFCISPVRPSAVMLLKSLNPLNWGSSIQRQLKNLVSNEI